MPKTFSLDELVKEMLLLQKIERVQEQIKNGEFYTLEEVNKEIDSWLQES